jgi:hypothetical protein
MQKVAVQQSTESISKISKMLLELGFDLQLLGSKRYVKEKLNILDPLSRWVSSKKYFFEMLIQDSREHLQLADTNLMEKQLITRSQSRMQAQ